jgi:hypothetical protein
MPWTAAVDRHYRGLTDAGKRIWVAVASRQLAEHGDEGRAITEANAAVNRDRDRGYSG